MNNKETAAYLRKWVKVIHGIFAWPTDGCGYEQHMKFVKHRNNNWHGGTLQEFNKFILDYAETLEKE